jgi:cob(I)alamin adenosyltransferase
MRPQLFVIPMSSLAAAAHHVARTRPRRATEVRMFDCSDTDLRVQLAWARLERGEL